MHGELFFVSSTVRVADIIGRALVISEGEEAGGEAACCGIVARSASVFENEKRICLCDGTPVWDAENGIVDGA